ncbi:MAG: hypothetical protein M3Y87_05980 [Myxococcota bacterium]|nr:hypothetical protein [Myxococcota bacterium]
MLRDDREAQRFRIETLERALEDAQRELEAVRAAGRPAARARAWHRVAKVTIVVVAITVTALAVHHQRGVWSRALDVEAAARTGAEADRERWREDLARARVELAAERAARIAEQVERRAPMGAEDFGTILSPGQWQHRVATVTRVLGSAADVSVEERCVLNTLRGARCDVILVCAGRQLFPPALDRPDVHCGPEPAGPRLEADDHSLVVDLDGGKALLQRPDVSVEWTF